MRETLFRGKSTNNGEWVYGVPVIAKDDITDKDITVMVNNPNEIVPMEGLALFEQVEPETVDQYTGLTDKNGKKIFEGDIVRYKTEPCCTYQVVFENRNGSAYFGIVIDKNETWGFGNEVPARLLEVIGNIHDNPELMEVAQ